MHWGGRGLFLSRNTKMKAFFTPIRGILVKCTVRVRWIILESDALGQKRSFLIKEHKNEGHLHATKARQYNVLYAVQDLPSVRISTYNLL